MADDTEVFFKEKDIVWVKLDTYWWPGEVVDKSSVPETITESLKKEPVAIVKYFDEDYFQIVKTTDRIFKYDCSKKNDFIKRGMDAFRTKNPKLATFPKDVVTAEVRCGGNPNILSDPMFLAAEKRKSIIAEIFGTSTPKKPKESSNIKRKTSTKNRPIITHRRYLGYNDYESEILIQEPGQNWTNKEDFEDFPENRHDLNDDENYICPVCQYSCRRVGVIVAHVKFHKTCDANYFNTPYKLGLKKQKLKGTVKRKRTVKKAKENDSSPEKNADTPKKKSVAKKMDGSIVETPKAETKEEVDIYNDLLAEWDDEQDGELNESCNDITFEKLKESDVPDEAAKNIEGEDDTVAEEHKNESDDTKDNNKSTSMSENEIETKEYEPDISKKITESSAENHEDLRKTSFDSEDGIELPLDKVKTKIEDKNKEDKITNISCFDFEEEDEDSSKMVTESGRKIPRVIPVSEKRKSFLDDSDEEESEIMSRKKQILEESKQFNIMESNDNKDEKSEEIEKTYQDLMSSTSNIEMPEIPNVLKSEQNFHCDTTIKFPDKINEISEKIDEMEKSSDSKSEVEDEKEPKPDVENKNENFVTESECIKNDSFCEKLPLDSVDKISTDLPPETAENIAIKEKDVNDNSDLKNEVQNEDIENSEQFCDNLKENNHKNVLDTVIPNDSEISDKDISLESSLPNSEEADEKNKVEMPTEIVIKNLETSDDKKEIKEESMCFINNEQADKNTEIKSNSDVETKVSDILITKSPEKYIKDQNEKSLTECAFEKETSSSENKKLVVPKKRFVKSFENLLKSEPKPEMSVLKHEDTNMPKSTLSKDEIIKKSDSIKPYSLEKKSPREGITLNLKAGFKLKTKIISKIEKKLLSNKHESQNEDEKNILEKSPLIANKITKPSEKEILNNIEKLTTKNILENISTEIPKTPCFPNILPHTKPEDLFSRDDEIVDDLPTKIITKNFPLEPINPEETELVEIDGNLTVVSEKDLEEGQVEIATGVLSKQPLSLSNFSLDFADEKLDKNLIENNQKPESDPKVTIIQKSESISINQEKPSVPAQKKDVDSINKTEEKKPPKEKVKSTPSRLENALLKDRNSQNKNDLKNEIDPVKKPIVLYHSAKSSNLTELCDFEDHIPSQIVCMEDAILNEDVIRVVKQGSVDKSVDSDETSKDSKNAGASSDVDLSKLKLDPNNTNLLIQAAIKQKTPASTVGKPSKAIILSESIIRPGRSSGIAVKRSINEASGSKPAKIIKSIDGKQTKIIKSSLINPLITDPKVTSSAVVSTSKQTLVSTMHSAKTGGKAKILDQTIITPTGEIYHPNDSPLAEDVSEFDINSMPIVLSDELLTPESLEKMPIILSDGVQGENKVEKKIKTDKKLINIKLNTKLPLLSGTPSNLVKMVSTPRTSKIPNILQSGSAKSIKSTPLSSTSKTGKYVIVSDNTPMSIKKSIITKKTLPTPSMGSVNVPTIPSESVSHKVMIVTNNQGQQQRVLLTPAQQKLLGVQTTKTPKTLIKRGAQNLILGKSSLPQLAKPTGNLLAKSLTTSIQSANSATTSSLIKNTPVRRVIKNPVKTVPQQKTILIKNQLGQTVRKIQGTDEALLDKEVAKQLESLKASGLIPQQKPKVDAKLTPQVQRSYLRKQLEMVDKKKSDLSSKMPPLSPLKSERKDEDKSLIKSKVKMDSPHLQTMENVKSAEQPTQLVIQDGMGNMTPVKHGEIVAIPNDSGDGQNQSYVLFHVNESGNLLPLSNEELMSLDTNLTVGAGAIESNVLPINSNVKKIEEPMNQQIVQQPELSQNVAENLEKPNLINEVQNTEQVRNETFKEAENMQNIAVKNEPPGGQQLVLTGDPVATQKFLDTLTDANADIANLLASSGGGSFIIQADKQQILIETQQSDNQIVLSINALPETTVENEVNQFFNSPIKNQDILAAALADTDVLQPEQNVDSKVMHAQLSPSSSLFPNVTANILEPTSLTLNSPIMTPLEVPSTNSKKISDNEANILTQVPKNVDLPITITDPNISHTVSQQVIGNEVSSNLELSIPVSENVHLPSSASDINSPNFVYSLPGLVVSDSVDINQKSFNGSMPLLTEDIEDHPELSTSPSHTELILNQNSSSFDDLTNNEPLKNKKNKKGFINSESFLPEGLCTLGGQLCSSLSEPPPEMFESTVDQSTLPLLGCKLTDKSDSESINCNENSTESADLKVNSPVLANEDSMEIPCQPQIIADLRECETSEKSNDSPEEVSLKQNT